MSPLFKNTYREILRSPGRFLAILAIIVLGSGFFVGLRVSQNAMISTANTYLSDTSFHDFSISTTLGLTDDDVAAIAAEPEVLDAEGAFSVDALVNLGGETDVVYAFHSLPSRIDTPDLISGRLPEADGECLADSWADVKVGDTVYISSANDPDTLELFTVRAFTVTGIATSPIYLNFERGSTDLGIGSLTAFCYVPMSAFDVDYYTAVNVRCEAMPSAYSKEYDSRAEALEPRLTDIAEARAQARYDSILSDARSRLSDGWDEYNSALSDYETQRADAESELADALSELKDAKAQLDDAAAQIVNGRAELEDGKKELAGNEKTLRDAEKDLSDAKAQLDDAAAQIADGQARYDDGAAELETQRADGERLIAESRSQLEEALRVLEDGEAEYSENLALYESALRQYDDGAAQLRESRRTLREGERQYAQGLAEYDAALAQYEDALDELEAAKAQLDASKALLDASQAAFDGLMEKLLDGINAQLPSYGLPPYASVDELLAALERGDFIAVYAVNTALKIASEANPGADIPADSAALLAVRDQLSTGWDDYYSGLAQYNDAAAYLDSLYAQLDAAKAVLTSSRQELDDGWIQLEAGRIALDESAAQLEDAKAQLDSGRRELDDGWSEYNTGLAQLENAEAELADATAQAEAQLADAKAELEDAQRQYDDGLAQYEDGLQEYLDGLKKFNDGKAQLADAETRLSQAESEYADGLAEYESGLAEYTSARAEADREFADAEAELSDAKAQLEDSQRVIDELEPPSSFVLGRWANLGYACFESDTAIVRSISAVFPVFFFLVAALICITTVSRMVEEQRSQLGVLMAMGYSPLAVTGKFLFYSGSATLIGGVAGILLGSKLIPLVVWQAYHIMYSFSDTIEFYFDLPLSAVTFSLYLVSMLLVTWLSCRRELHDVPANVIRPKPPKSGKRVMLERVPFVWNRLSFLWKVTVRNIFRYKSRVLMMILGIAGCTALMMTGMGVNDSIRNVVDYQFTEISLYHFAVTFDDLLTGDDMAGFSGSTASFASNVLYLSQTTRTAQSGHSEKEVQLNVIPDASLPSMPDFMDFHSGASRLSLPGHGEVLINSGLAKSLDLSAGDDLTLRSEDGSSMTLTVSGVYDNYIYNSIYITSDTYVSATGDRPGINYALIKQNDDADTGECLAAILGSPNVLTATASRDLRQRIGNMMDSLKYIVLLTIICAAALAFVVIYNLTNINIQERLREIATVKVLGFYDLESALYVLRENLLLTLLGAAVGIPMGLALNAYVVGQIELDMIHFTPRVLPASVLWSVALAILFSLTVDLLMYRRLTRINPASALKAAE